MSSSRGHDEAFAGINDELRRTPEPIACEVEPLGAGWRLLFPASRVLIEVPRTYWHSNGQVDATYLIYGLSIAQADPPRRLDFGTLNLQSSQTRAKLAKQLTERGHEAAWQAIMDEFAGRIIELVTAGEEPVVLTDIEVAGLKPANRLLGTIALEGDTSMIFGHGGDGKSYVALAVGASLAGGYGLLDINPAKPMRVAYLDWEWRPEEHARRLRQLIGDDRLPHLYHFQCRRPLAAIVDGLAVKFARYGIEYAVVDSVAWACGGAPEKSEMATAFQAALRQLGVGSLSIAHTNRQHDTTMPFGSVFWWNAMRSIWFLKRVPSPSEDMLGLELYHRKTNSSRLDEPMAFSMTWDGTGRVTMARGEVRRVAPLKVRMAEALDRVGLPMTAMELALAVGPSAAGKQPSEADLLAALKRDAGKTFEQLPGAPPRWVLTGSTVTHEPDDNADTPLDPGSAEGGATTPARARETQGSPTHGESDLSLSPNRDTANGRPGPDTSEAGPARPSSVDSTEAPREASENPREAERAYAVSGDAPREQSQVEQGRDILAGFRASGLTFRLDHSQVRVGPRNMVGDELRAMLADPEFKAAVVAALREEGQR